MAARIHVRGAFFVLLAMLGVAVASASLASAAPTCFGRAPTIVASGSGDVYGTSGDDVILGTAAGETIFAGAGDDLICSQGGNDVVYGDAGNDRIRLGRGDDRAWGGPGADTIRGGAGEDIIYGESGRDRLHGGAGRDVVLGGRDGDILRGNRGADTIHGNGGNDAISGGRAIDTCKGGDGADTLSSCNEGSSGSNDDPSGGASCSSSYPTVCIPPGPPDLNCGDITARNFRVVGVDPHNFDGDGDGIGCETRSSSPDTSTRRVGAICRDGWRSYSTGSGTCSHHGGVDYWLYG